MRNKDLTGQRFGRLVALEIVSKDKYGHNVWRCRCDCGNEIKVASDRLLTGNTKSCGCYRRDLGKIDWKRRLGYDKP